MRRLKFLVLISVFTLASSSSSSFSQVAALVKKQEPFKAQGVVTRVDLAAKIFLLKNEGGLELTYFADDSTDFGGSDFSSLATGENVEVTYRYNENYEKIALTVRSSTTSAGKTSQLPT